VKGLTTICDGGTRDRNGYTPERIPGPGDERQLNVIRGIHRRVALTSRSPVLYVHGGTFPSALAIGWRFDGRSWMDDLCDAGFDVWGFDFLGFGGSDRYEEMALPANAHPPLGRAPYASHQLECVVRHILSVTGAPRVTLLAHSWGSQPAALFTTTYPKLVDRVVLFGPILERHRGIHTSTETTFPAYTFVTRRDQWQRFTEDAPADRPVLLERHFAPWAEAYLSTDPENQTREPPSVQIPSGPMADIAAAWQGRLPYDPARIRAPTLLVRGEWDSLCDDRDAAWLAKRLTGAPFRDRRLARGTHLMHLEELRFSLWGAVREFLSEPDTTMLRNEEDTPCST